MAVDNIGLVRRFTEEVWNKGNMNVCDELLSKQMKVHDPLLGDLDGLDAAKRQIQAFRTAFPDFHVAIDDIGGIGDKVYVRWTATGTHKGSLMGINPTNKKGINSGVTLNRIENGKFVETYYVWDVYKMIEQLGLLPPLQKLVASGAQPAARV
jgi:steroid delta-isomerase-like uncharacterized protein